VEFQPVRACIIFKVTPLTFCTLTFSEQTKADEPDTVICC